MILMTKCMRSMAFSLGQPGGALLDNQGISRDFSFLFFLYLHLESISIIE